MNQTPESASPNDIVYPVVECPRGPHDVIAFMVPKPDGSIGLVFCPLHHTILNLHTGVTFKEWLTAEELHERGFEKLG